MGISSTLQLLFEINADPTHAIAAMDLLGGAVASRLGVSQKSFEQFGAASLAAAKDLAYLGAGVGAMGAAWLATAEHAAHYAEEIGHVAEKSGATTEQVSTLDFAAKRMGVSTDAVNNGLRFLARNLGDISEGQGKKAATAFADLGINVHDADGKVRSVSAVLPEVVPRLGAMEAGGHRTSDAMAIFGRGGAAVLPMLGQFRDGLDVIQKQAASMGLVIGRDDVEAATKFLIAQRTLTAEMDAFNLVIGRELLPFIIILFIKLESFPLLLKEIGLEILQLTSYLAGPVGMLANWLILTPKIVAAHKQMDQAVTDGLIALDKEVKAALAAGIAHDTEGKVVTASGKAHADATKAVKDHAAVLPPIIKAMMDIWNSRASEEIHKQALALVDFRGALTPLNLQFPTFNAYLKAMGGTLLTSVIPAYQAAGSAWDIYNTKMLAGFARLDNTESKYTARVNQDKVLIINAHKDETIAAAQPSAGPRPKSTPSLPRMHRFTRRRFGNLKP